MRTLADAFGTDVEIVRRSDEVVRAYCRTGASEEIHDVLRQCGFTASDPHGSCCYHLPADTPGADQPAAASTAAAMLDDAGYRVGIDHHLVVGYVGQNCVVPVRGAAARCHPPYLRRCQGRPRPGRHSRGGAGPAWRPRPLKRSACPVSWGEAP
ncbi:hypothetical protein ACFVXG_27965 [Kitasatospora sp. NPDC058162]|uniref:hypothetical protein n=1 Tax=Kitasatospora sp. NPDC058162 TaxID=3346362 RepID=UPI0036DDCAFE